MNSKLIKIINEEISAIKKDKDKEIFNYDSIVNSAWSDKIHDAQDFQRIAFDLENNYSTGQKKTFYSKQNLRKDQPVKYEINAELCEANGDWQIPVLYFKLEITHDYGLIKSDDWKKSHEPQYIWDVPNDEIKQLSHCFVIIPPVEAGNKLNKGDSTDKYDWYAFDNNEVDEREFQITDEDKRNSWKWLQELLDKLIRERHEMLDEPDDVEIEDSEG